MNSSQRSFSSPALPSIPEIRANRSKRPTDGQLRMAPRSLEAEQSTLGAMLMEPEAIVRARKILNAEDFYSSLHVKIFKAILALADKGDAVNFVTVAEELRTHDQLEDVGGAEYLSALHDACPSSAAIDSYTKIVFDLSQKRQLTVLAGELEVYAFNGKSSGDIRNWLRGKLDVMAARVPTETAKEWSAAELMTQSFEPPRCAVENMLPIGLTIFAGAPKIGKSWFSYAVALAVASGGHVLGKYQVEAGKALYLALEDQPRRLQDRLSKLLQGPNGTQAAPENLRLYCDWPRMDEGGLDQMEAWLVANPDCRLVIVDTLQKIRPTRDGSNFYEEDYAHFAALKRVADKYEVAIVVVLHTSKRETTDALQSIAGSTGQVGAADAILVLNRSRNGNEGKLYCVGRDIDEREIPLRWTADIGTWTEVDEDEAAQATMSTERREIIDILATAPWPMAPRQIAEMLDKKQGAVRRLLWSMKNAGEVRTYADDTYDLPPDSKYRTSTDAPMQRGPGYSPPVAAAVTDPVTGVTTVTAVSPNSSQGRSSRSNAVTRVTPSLPPWLSVATIRHGQSINLAVAFWNFWHDRYESALDESAFDATFPDWIEGNFPEPPATSDDETQAEATAPATPTS